VIVATDRENVVFEDEVGNPSAKANNRLSGTIPVVITSNPADLRVTGLSTPAVAEAGAPVVVSWTVQNAGTGDSIATDWTDRLILSNDADHRQ